MTSQGKVKERYARPCQVSSSRSCDGTWSRRTRGSSGSLIAQQAPLPLSPEQELELDEAWREHEQTPGAVRPWQEVYAQILVKL